MPAGSIAIYREVAGGEDVDITSWTDLDHDTTVFEDTKCFAKEVGGAGVALLEAGHYLAFYNEAVGISGTLDRCTFRGQLELDGVAVGGSLGHGFIRGYEGCDECFGPYCASIFEAVADDVLKVQIIEEVAGTPSPLRTGGYPGLQLLKLDDNWDYCRLHAYRFGHIQDVGDDILWESTIEEDTDTFSHSGKYITLKAAGWYLCTYSLGWQNTSSPPKRSTCNVYVQSNSLPVEKYEQSYTSSYVRHISGSFGATCGVFLIHTTAPNQTITMKTDESSPNGGTFGAGADVYISLVALPSEINKLDVFDGTGAESFDVSETSFPWSDEEEDDSAFSHDTSTDIDDVVIEKPGPFLFLANFYGYRTSGDSNRYNTLARFRDGGAALSYGCSGDYSRQYTDVPYHGASHGAILPWLSIGDIIDFSREDTSTSSGTQPKTSPDKMGLQAIYLPSIFPAYWQNGGFFAQQISGVT